MRFFLKKTAFSVFFQDYGISDFALAGEMWPVPRVPENGTRSLL